MSIVRRGMFALVGALGIGAMVVSAPGVANAWEPKKPVEFIIMAGTGGGADQIARLLQGLIEQKDLSPRPFIPINMAGGSGGEALRYMQGKAGDDHTVLVTLNSFYTTPIIQEDLGVDVTQFTPIGRMALDTFLLWVQSDSDIQDLESYVAAVKAADGSWKVGGTGSGQEDSILTAMMEAEFDYKVTYIPFPGGGTVAKNLIGKHIDSTVNNPAEQTEFWRAGQSRPIVQFTSERMDIFPDVPTAKEMGHDIEYYMQRSINGPPGMSQEAQEWYINLFKTLYETQLARQKQLIDSVGAAAITGE